MQILQLAAACSGSIGIGNQMSADSEHIATSGWSVIPIPIPTSVFITFAVILDF